MQKWHLDDLTGSQKMVRQDVKASKGIYVQHLFLVDSANDKIGGSEFSSSSSSLKLTFGRLPFCFSVPVHPFAAACKRPITMCQDHSPHFSDCSFVHTFLLHIHNISSLCGYIVLAAVIKYVQQRPHLACLWAAQGASSGCSQAGAETDVGPPDETLHRHL